ncbi:AAA family ATPase, partial [Escherichia coli]
FLVDSQLEQVEDLLALHAELKRGPKSAEAIQRFAVVTFHQSYGYEEFIEGMRARSDESGNISYPIEPGIFMRLCQRANADPAHRYAIFIDEINRGNISKIFGELISLIEVDKRAGMPNAMSLQLSYSGDHFSVPANVDIIGAMNTADRSLALLDTALRRRFDFVEMMPDLSLLSGAKVKGIELESLLEKLNSRIEALYDREHTLGHAFFMPVKNALDTGDEETAFKQLKIA